MLLPTCWFDRVKCKTGIEALRMYRREYDDKRQEFRVNPLHDWTSHPVSAMEYWAATLESKRMIAHASQRRSDRAASKNAKHYAPKWTNPYSTPKGPSPYKRRVA